MKMFLILPALLLGACGVEEAGNSPLSACEAYYSAMNDCVAEMGGGDTLALPDTYCSIYEDVGTYGAGLSGKTLKDLETQLADQFECSTEILESIDCSDPENMTALSTVATDCM